MTFASRLLFTSVVVVGLTSNATAEPAAKPAPNPAVPVAAELSDDAIFTKLFASRDFCKKIDAANAAAWKH